MDVVTRELADQEGYALPLQLLGDLERAVAVDTHADADGSRTAVDPGKASALHNARAGDGAEDRDADFGQGPSGRQLFAATDARAHAANDRASLDHDERVAGVAGFQPPAVNAFGVKDLDAGTPQGRHH